VDVVLSAEAKDLMSAEGGGVYVRSHEHHCGRGGPLVLLDVVTDPPPDADAYEPVLADGVPCGITATRPTSPTSSPSRSTASSGAA